MNKHFFAYMYRLRYIERWSLMRNVVKENVAEHSYHTAIWTHALCTIANEIFNESIDTEKAVILALFHDATEIFTGDIPTPVKHHNPMILHHFREIEQTAAERLIGMIPEPLQSVYRPLIGGKQQKSLLRTYVKAADLIDSYLKCVTEMSTGNNEFAVAKQQIKQQIMDLQLPAAQYFLEQIAPSFEKTLDEMSGILSLSDSVHSQGNEQDP